MKKFAVVLTTILTSLSFSLTAMAQIPNINIPMPSVDINALIESSIMENISCSINASIKYVDPSKNTVTYSIDYKNNNESIIKKPYALQVGTDNELIINANGQATLAKGIGKITLPNGKLVSTFTVNPKTTSKVSFQANINGEKCTSKELATIKAVGIVSPINLTPNLGTINLNGTIATPSIAGNNGGVVVNPNGGAAVNPAPAPNDTRTCKIIAEGALKNNSVLMGAAIDYDGYDPKLFPFTIRGYSESKPNDVREYKGNQQLANGHNYVLNSDNRGFLFELPLSQSPETYIITGTLGGKDCSLVSFAVPSAPTVASAQNGAAASTTGTTLGTSAAQTNSTVEVFSNSPQDAQVAAQLALAQNATNEGAQDSDSSWAINILYVLGGMLVAGLLYALYRKFSQKM